MKSLSTFVFIFILFPMPLVHGQPSSLKPNPVQDELIKRSLDYAYQDSFAASYRLLDSILVMRNDYWPAIILKAGIIYMEMTDDERYDSQPLFQALIDSSLKGLDYHLKTSPDDVFAIFFKGTALGYQAVWEAQHGGWLKAISKGLKAGKYFAEARKMDTLFFEPLAGLGNLHYWRSAKIGFLRSLPLIPDQRQQGIEELELALRYSRYGKATAGLSLGWIYIHKKDYTKALQIAAEIEKQGCSGRQLLWMRAIAHLSARDYRNTIADFGAIREGLVRRGNQNNYNLITCDYYLGLAHYQLGNYDDALVYFKRIFDYPVSSEIADKLSKRFDSAREFIKRISSSEK